MGDEKFTRAQVEAMAEARVISALQGTYSQADLREASMKAYQQGVQDARDGVRCRADMTHRHPGLDTTTLRVDINFSHLLLRDITQGDPSKKREFIRHVIKEVALQAKQALLERMRCVEDPANSASVVGHIDHHVGDMRVSTFDFRPSGDDGQ